MMKKRLVALMIISLFLMTSIATASNIVIPDIKRDENIKPDNITIFIADIFVDDDADPSWYDATHVKTINEGIANASEGDTIFVYNGTYFETIKINKTIYLIGENNQTTIINGGNTGQYIILICVDWVNISSFTIQNSSYSELAFQGGIVVTSNNITIKNNIFTKNFIGIQIRENPFNFNDCYNLNIINNTFLDDGMLIFSAFNSIICGNYFINNHPKRAYDGILIINSYNNKICSNYFIGEYDCVLYIDGCDNNTFQNNDIKGSISQGIWLIESNKNDIHHNNIENNFQGILLEDSNCNKIHHNNFKKCLIKATFVQSSFNRWHHNYWGRPRILPKIIFGTKGIIGLIPWFNIDLLPAKKPYDIRV